MSKAEVQRRIGVTCWVIESLCSRLSISLGRFGSGLTSNERRRVNLSSVNNIGRVAITSQLKVFLNRRK